MAGIMHKTSRLMAAVLLGCLLAGCGGQLLSHREIVRAVFYRAGCRLHGHAFDQ